VGGIVEIAVPGSGGGGSASGEILLALFFAGMVAMIATASVSAWAARRR
jgi:hypothetical protein